MWSVSQRFLDALATGHEAVTYADVWYDGNFVATNIPISDGSIAMREDSPVRRTLTLASEQENLSTTELLELFSPFGTRVHVRSGVRFSQGDEEVVPVGVFAIEDTGIEGAYSGQTITAADLALLVKDDRFIVPHNTNGERTVPEEIAYLIAQSVGDVEVFDLTFNKSRTPTGTWDRDRWQCIEALAAGIGAECFFDPQGRAIIRPVPEVGASSASVWSVSGGTAGVLSDYSTGLSRDQVYNAVSVSGEATPDRPAVTAAVYQATGPVRWAGPFGRVPRFYSSPILSTYDGAVEAGRKILARSVAYSRRLVVDVVPNAALDIGDQINVTLPDGTAETRIVREVTLPLGNGTMRVGTRVGIDALATSDPGTLQ